jgi:hypothetical protein
MDKALIDKLNKVHNSKYDYSKSIYINARSKITIICPEHGEFSQVYHAHLNGSGCPKCGLIKKGNSRTSNTEKFITKSNNLFNSFYDYSLVDYKKAKVPVIIICPEHGEFSMTPDKHLGGRGCPICSKTIMKGKMRKDSDILMSQLVNLNGDRYDYSLVDYIDSKTPIKIICPEHGVFEQTPSNHIDKKQNCPKCVFKDILPEGEIKEFLIGLGLEVETNNKTILKGKELDIFISSHKLAIEYNGLYWHSEKYRSNDYHLNKTELCEEKGIQLIHIFEDEWLHKTDIVKSRIRNILGFNNIRIYARKCEVREVNTKDKTKFLNKNHIQGAVGSKVNLGLYYNGELVGLMTFGGLRGSLGSKDNKNSWELLRFCNRLNTNVVGGASKLLNYFNKVYEPREVISYADRRWSMGNMYEKLGFEFIHNSKPNYWYIDRLNRLHRYNFRKDVLIKEGFDKNKSEHEIMLERSMYRIYDCGNKKYKIVYNEL